MTLLVDHVIIFCYKSICYVTLQGIIRGCFIMTKMYSHKLKKVVSLSLLPLFMVLATGNTLADDTEVYFNTDVAVKPNVLFILDLSASMSYPAGASGISRIVSLKNAMEAILDDRNLSGLRIGTMVFSDKTRLVDPIIDIDHGQRYCQNTL